MGDKRKMSTIIMDKQDLTYAVAGMYNMKNVTEYYLLYIARFYHRLRYSEAVLPSTFLNTLLK